MFSTLSMCIASMTARTAGRATVSRSGMLRTSEFALGLNRRANRRVLSVTVEGVPAGSLDLGVADVEDPDDPKVRLDYVRVNEQFLCTGLSVALVREVQALWPLARILGGPVSQDDDPGPRFRLRCWDEAAIEITSPTASRAGVRVGR